MKTQRTSPTRAPDLESHTQPGETVRDLTASSTPARQLPWPWPTRERYSSTLFREAGADSAPARLPMRVALAWSSMVLGLVLFTLTLAGTTRALGGYQNLRPRPWERFEPTLSFNVSSVDALYAEAERRAGRPLQSLPPARAMEALYQVTSARLTHGHLANYNLFSNWILWGLSQLYPPAAYIQDPDQLLRYGHSVLCDQAAELLTVLARRLPLPARMVNITGHLVMEARYDGAWHMYDPDLEVVPLREGVVMSVSGLAGAPELVRALYDKGDDPTLPGFIGQAFGNSADDVVTEFPPADGVPWHEPSLSPRRYRLELGANLLKYLLPLMMMGAGIGVGARPRRRGRVGIQGGRRPGRPHRESSTSQAAAAP